MLIVSTFWIIVSFLIQFWFCVFIWSILIVLIQFFFWWYLHTPFQKAGTKIQYFYIQPKLFQKIKTFESLSFYRIHINRYTNYYSIILYKEFNFGFCWKKNFEHKWVEFGVELSRAHVKYIVWLIKIVVLIAPSS